MTQITETEKIIMLTMMKGLAKMLAQLTCKCESSYKITKKEVEAVKQNTAMAQSIMCAVLDCTQEQVREVYGTPKKDDDIDMNTLLGELGGLS